MQYNYKDAIVINGKEEERQTSFIGRKNTMKERYFKEEYTGSEGRMYNEGRIK